MATDAIITLESLRCISESDGTGQSEPYIWPVLLWIDDNTLATSLLVGVTAPVLGDARVVIKKDMSAGEIADIPASVGVLRVRLEDGLMTRRLILAVALWEEDETPDDAMRAGFQSFSSELRAAVADNLFALYGASEEEQNTIIETIKIRVTNRVRSAIEDGLTGWQKARVLLGTLNLDDIINSDFKNFPNHETPITLAFRAGSSNNYEIQGSLLMRPVRVDLCQAKINAVQTAQIAVDGIDGEIRALQAELRQASPSDKPRIIMEINNLREEELPILVEALENARRALQACRERQPVLTQGGVLDVGNKAGVDRKEIQGFKTKTFFNERENIEVIIASDGKSTIVAVPKIAISRRRQMGDDEFTCLTKCLGIADLEQRLNCILSCPITKEYQVFMF